MPTALRYAGVNERIDWYQPDTGAAAGASSTAAGAIHGGALVTNSPPPQEP
ncbi:MAG: hypothetical protein KDA24_22840 [Deltaproteobacteria bacterium]|nr:hypothetical protein [Deltaproteobacteria bacterium]